MAKKVGELFVELVVDAASGNLSVRQLVGALGELDVASAASVGILSKVGETLAQMASAAIDSAVDLQALADLTGEDPKIVQQWDKAAASVVGSTGVIIKAINSVKEINKHLSVGQGAPASMTGLLGLSAYKTNAEGKEVVKDAKELMQAMAKPGSHYRSLSREQQQQGLSDIFGGNADNVFRVINSMIAGKFHPEREPAMNGRQVQDLNDIRMKEIHLGQELTGIFQNLLTGGHAFADILDAITKKLEVVDAWMGSKQGKSAIGATVTAISDFITSAGSPPALVDAWMGSKQGKSAIGKLLYSQIVEPVAPPRAAGSTVVKVDDLRGKLDINILHNGNKIGSKTTFIERGVTNADVLNATLVQGNTP